LSQSFTDRLWCGQNEKWWIMGRSRDQFGPELQPLYLARIEDLRHGDLVKVDCTACYHVALLTPESLLRLSLDPRAKVLDLKTRVRCRGCVANDAISCDGPTRSKSR
jgi:hypothetical protein